MSDIPQSFAQVEWKGRKTSVAGFSVGPQHCIKPNRASAVVREVRALVRADLWGCRSSALCSGPDL